MLLKLRCRQVHSVTAFNDIIFTIIRTAASYVATRPEPKRKDFKPELNLILFEEPQAFLHPSQQEILDASFRELVKDPGRQVADCGTLTAICQL